MGWAAAAPYVIPIATSLVGGMMGGKGGRRNPSPQLPAGLESLLNIFSQTAGRGLENLDFSGFTPGAGYQADVGQQALLSSLMPQLGGVGSAFGQGLTGLTEGAATGYLPNFTGQIESYLRPGLERSFERGAAGLREQGAFTGTLSGSNMLEQLSNLRGGLEAGLGENMANIYGGALPAAISARSAAVGQSLGLPGQMLGALEGPIGQTLQGSQFQQAFPLQAIQGAAGGISGLPFYQPSYRPGKSGMIGQGLMAAAPAMGGKK